MSMQISNGYSSAFHAYNRGVNTVNQAASRIAQMPAENVQKSVDEAEEAVNLKYGELQAEAGAKVFDVYDKTIGSIIDIKV